jgi:hypothetical protein
VWTAQQAQRVWRAQQEKEQEQEQEQESWESPILHVFE